MAWVRQLIGERFREQLRALLQAGQTGLLFLKLRLLLLAGFVVRHFFGQLMSHLVRRGIYDFDNTSYRRFSLLHTDQDKAAYSQQLCTFVEDICLR